METGKKVLLVDDETDITVNLAQLLERMGFIVDTANNGEAALEKVESFIPDIVVLDVMMPKMNGREVLRQMRASDDWIPVILLTQVGDAFERAIALEEGADDYLNKPFDPHELVARIKTILRRANMGQAPLSASQKIACENILLDRSSRRVYLDGDEVNLTPKAVTLLEHLMLHPDDLLSREQLLNAVWGWDYPIGPRAVDTRIAELRRALDDTADEPRLIETVPGQGYRFIGEVKRI